MRLRWTTSVVKWIYFEVNQCCLFWSKFLLHCSSSIFLPVSLLVSFISIDIKTRILLCFLSQALIILYIAFICFPILFYFHKCLNNFHKQKSRYKYFFCWNICSSFFHFHDVKELPIFLEVKQSHAIKNKVFPFYSHW